MGEVIDCNIAFAHYAQKWFERIKNYSSAYYKTGIESIVEHNYASADYISYGGKTQRKIKFLDDKGTQQLFHAILNYDNIKAKTAI